MKKKALKKALRALEEENAKLRKRPRRCSRCAQLEDTVKELHAARDRALRDFNSEMACNRRTREILEVPDHADIHIWAEGRMRQLRQKFLIGKGTHAEPS